MDHHTEPAAPRQTWLDRLLFLRKFLRHGKKIASVTPSSRWLSSAMVSGIDFAQCRCIVELGAGTGPITAELLRRAPKSCKLVIIERDRDFVAILRTRFPAQEIIQGSAEDLLQILRDRGVEKADHIISGLALPSFPEPNRQRVFDAIAACLAPGGTLRQLTEVPWYYLRTYKRHFHSVTFRLVLRNIPPGGYYICSNPKR